MKRTSILSAALLATFASYAGWDLTNKGEDPAPIPIESIRTLPTGIELAGPKGTMRLQVFSPTIVRVIYSRTGSMPTNSPAVLARPEKTDWKPIETQTNAGLETSALRVEVDRKTGAVSFFDANGMPLLHEPPEGGKAMTPTQIAGADTWICRQVFELAKNEALYGLGQHQNGAMNYRGRSIKMAQDNPGESAVPVLLSSQGYGILWDNPALAVVDATGDDLSPIPSSALIDAEGRPGALTATYFAGENFETAVATQRDDVVDFDWKDGAPEGLPNDSFSIRWEGVLKAPDSGTYRLRITSDDGVRLWVDGKKVVDSWILRAKSSDLISLPFEKDSLHQIKLEYFDKIADACVRLEWDLPDGDNRLDWTAEAGRAIDYYFMYGPEPDDVVADYRKLTGHVPMLGRWAWGFWQSKERYLRQQELIDVVERFRKDDVPIDGIVQDWHYWPDLDKESLAGGWGSHEFDPVRYPDPGKMVETLHDLKTHVLISVWPWFQRNDEGTGIPNLEDLDAIGAVFPLPGKTWAGNMSWYDPFAKKARDVYWSQVKPKILDLGFDAFWLDSTEPVAGGDAGALRDYPTLVGPGCEVVNAYPLLHCDGVYEGQRKATNDKRVFILTRSAYAGLQRDAAVVWSGDIDGKWEVFRKQIPAGLNFSLSGLPYWNTDIGGFWIRRAGFEGPGTPAYDELFTRWYQYGAFCPMFRVHGSEFAKEYWRFPDPTKKILIDFDRLRYRLLPYVYSLAWMVTDRDYTMMRPLLMDFRADPKTFEIPDQYLFGPALMVCPVLEAGATTRKIYLPKGANWFDFWSGKPEAGGRTIDASAPIERIPLFVRAGSILPMGRPIQHAGEDSDPLEIRVYPGADGRFDLYEDEGDGYAYEKGAYSLIPFKWDDKTRTLFVGNRQGSFPGMKKNRTFRLALYAPGTGEKPTPVVRSVSYGGKLLKVPFKR